jgi:hypothetical protein
VKGVGVVKDEEVKNLLRNKKTRTKDRDEVNKTILSFLLGCCLL